MSQASMNGYINRRANNVAAWALKPKDRPLVVSSAPQTSPPKDHVVIQVTDVAINPIDWIIQGSDTFGLKYPAVLGIDVAGEIVEVGEGVDDAADGLRAGNRVIAHCNAYQTSDPSHGAFQKFVVVPKNSVCELPYSIPASVGVVLPLGITTAAAGLYQKGFLGLPFPSESPEKVDRTVLIWGGSSSVGSCAIQLAIASGVEVFTTASAKNFDYCKKLGAKEVFDYHDKDVAKQIATALGKKTFAGAYHAQGGEDVIEACAKIADESKGKAIVVTVKPGGKHKNIPSSVRIKDIQSASIFQNEVGPMIWREFLPKALRSGTIVPKPDPLIVGEELRSVQLGLDRQKAGVSAAKVVVTNISRT